MSIAARRYNLDSYYKYACYDSICPTAATGNSFYARCSWANAQRCTGGTLVPKSPVPSPPPPASTPAPASSPASVLSPSGAPPSLTMAQMRGYVHGLRDALKQAFAERKAAVMRRVKAAMAAARRRRLLTLYLF